MYVFLQGYDLLDPSHETKALEDLPKITLLEDEHGNFHLKNLSMHQVTYIHTYLHTNIHTYLHTYIYIYIHTFMHTYIHTYIYTYTLFTYTHKHTYTFIIYTYIHRIYICTCIHTYTYIIHTNTYCTMCFARLNLKKMH